MFGLGDLFSSLSDNRPADPPPGRDDEAEAAAVLAQLEERMPTPERGKSWLLERRNDQPFLTHHRAEILKAIPALRMGATSAWIDLLEESSWEPDLGSDELVRILTAMLDWQAAAAQRALARLDIEVSGFRDLAWPPLMGETERYLIDQSASDAVLNLLRTHANADQVAFLVELGVAASDCNRFDRRDGAVVRANGPSIRS
jgi:hypothetical protein